MALISSLCIFVLVAHFATPIVCTRSPINQTPALFVFGDSIFDPGNNNYINTTASFQANYLPYGESFFKDPTGRTSNGRLIPDFIGIFIRALSIQWEVIDLQTQLKNFRNVTQLLKNKVGETESKQIISNAVYIFSTGTNDFTPLVTNSTFPNSDTGYLQMIMGNLTSVLKGVYEEGGRKFVMLNLAPLGCLPSVRNLNLQKGVTNGSCMEEATNLAKMFNSALPEMLKKLEKQLPGFKYTIFNFFKVVADSIDNPTKYGFKISETTCCGMGPFRGILSCGGKRQVKEYEVCKNVKDYLFFDSSHPSEQAYQKYTELLWNGTPDVVAPYNLKSFFKLST
ncbi:GDSL esterase/lipase 5-like [Solanum stenotomum]|uniref:GDSL esterase/lipase 5-like n=1 Tax=Solanum stenotomum TaxID=172797 RepID=UPI0020D00F07|nr:GDSL esterase/lipase 5-like [Solanum stenotomum]